MALSHRPNSGRIEFRHLRYFLAIVDEMNFSRAAETLNIAQPGLSQQIRNLEEILGTLLFDRSRRALRLTLAGEMFATEARKVLVQVDSASQVAQRAGRGEIGRIAIGYVSSAAYSGMLTHVVGDFRKSYPLVQLEIAESEMLRQLDAIGDGRLDVGFIRPPAPLPPGVATMSMLQEEILICLPADHALAGEKKVELEKLKDAHFITPHHPPRVSFHQYTTDACNAAGFQPHFGPRGKDFVTIASMVSVELGVALVPQSVQCIRLPNIVYRRVAGLRQRADLAIAFRRGDGSPVVRAFIESVRARTRG